MQISRIEHVNGVPWHAAPAPPKKHTHWAQTTGWTEDFHLISRCACGAFQEDGLDWFFLDPPRVEQLRPTARFWRILFIVSGLATLAFFALGLAAPVLNGVTIVSAIGTISSLAIASYAKARWDEF